MNASIIDLYERLAAAPDERTRARIIAEAFDELEQRYPNLSNMVTQQGLRETELRLTREIEQLRTETREIELRLVERIDQTHLEIEQIRSDLIKEIEQVRADLTKEIEQIRTDLTKEIERLRAETQAQFGQTHAKIEATRADVIKWSFLFWISQMGALLVILWRLLGTA